MTVMNHNQLTIAIIDDCPEDRETYRRYLLQDSRHTYTIWEEESGEQGLALCSQVKPDAILLDFRLPDIDGLEFIRELKTQECRTSLPVVMLTGQGNEAIAVAAMKSGACDYLVKGKTTPESLRLAIHNVIERDRLKRQLEKSEERFRTSIENMLDCFGIYTSVRDESGRIVDFTIDYLNAAACSNNCMTAEQQIGKRLLELQPSHAEAGLFDEYVKVVETGQPLIKESLIYTDIQEQQLSNAFNIRATKLGDGFVAAWHNVTEKKQAIEALRQSEEKYRLLAEATPQCVWIYQADGKVEYCNQHWYDYTGLTEERTLGWGWLSILHPDDVQLALERWNRAKELGESYDIEYRFKRAEDEVYRWHLGRVTPIRDRQARIVKWMGTAIDIHDRKQADEQLRQSQRLIQQIADTNPDLLYLYDLKEQRNVYVNRQSAEVLGYTQEAIESMKISVLQNLIHPDDLARLPAYLERLTASEDGEAIEFEYRLRQANGEWRWLRSRDTIFTRDANGLPLQILGTTRNITKHKKSEAALRESEERLRLAVEGAALGTWHYDIPSGRILCSERCKAIFGLVADKSDLNYNFFKNCLHPEDRQRVNQTFSQAIETREDYDVECRVVWPDGSARWIAAKGRVFDNESGQPTRMVGIVQDISDRKQMEEERQQLLAREQAARATAEAADRAKDEFLAMVSHELRTPLTAILGYTQLLQTGMVSDDTSTHALETIEDNAKLQAQLVDDLLDISRIISGKFSLNADLVDLAFVIDAAIDTVYLAAQDKDIQIKPIIDPTAGCVLGDANRLQQIIWNLLSNSIKFTPKGGLIQIQLERIDDRVCITVNDTGAGISAEFLPYVFNRFYQAQSNDRHGGLGLGLAIVHHLVELHGGTVDVFSDGEGKGATFTVQLPLALVVVDTAIKSLKSIEC